MSDLKLGQLIGPDAKRDAIHVAIAPVEAAERLAPGQAIGFVYGSNSQVGRSDKPIGIVDPFLTTVVHMGERFWMFLYPNTITALRHDWTHPAFKAEPQDLPASPLAVESEEWLEDFAERAGITYVKLMDAAGSWIECGEWLCFDHTGNDDGVPDEFWMHYQNVTGRLVPKHRQENFFTCSC